MGNAGGGEILWECKTKGINGIACNCLLMEGKCQLIGWIFFRSLISLAFVSVFMFLSGPQAVIWHYTPSSRYVLMPVGSELIPVA